MPRKTKRPDFTTRRQLATHLGVKLDTIRQWAYRYPSFPAPAASDPARFGTVYYDWGEVMRWVAQHRPNLLPTSPSSAPEPR